MPDDKEYVETTKMDLFGYTVPDGSDDYKKGFQDGVDFVLDRFYDLPREDVEPVVHAHWRYMGMTHDSLYIYACLKCGRRIFIADSSSLKHYPYCHCGAKMDEKVEEK